MTRPLFPGLVLIFETLGAVRLRAEGNGDGDGSAIPLSPKRLALLAYLACAPRAALRRRDTIVGLLWPGLDQEHARGALRQTLRHLRHAIGGAVVLSQGEGEVGISAEHLRCDAVELESLCSAEDAERALALYSGDFLEGVFVPDVAPEFEEWVEGERMRLRRLAGHAAWRVAERRHAGGDGERALSAARRAVTLLRDDEGAVRQLMSLHDALGDRAGSLRAYDELERRMRAEYGASPSSQTQALAAAVRSPIVRNPSEAGALAVPGTAESGARHREGNADHATASEIGPETESATATVGSTEITRIRPPRRVHWRWLIGAPALILLVSITATVNAIRNSRGRSALAAHVPAPVARAAVLRAKLHLMRRDTTSIREARREFAAAIDADPLYADAYAGLGYAYGAMAHYNLLPSPEAFNRGDAAARRALELDPGNGFAVALLASTRSFRDWRWSEGEREFRRALRLAPDNPDVHNLFGIHLRVLGRYDEALAEMEKARSLDPITRHYDFQVAQVLLCAGRYPESLAEFRRSMELGVTPATSHLGASKALARLERWDEALAEWAAALSSAGEAARAAEVRRAQGRAGYDSVVRATSQTDLASLLRAATRGYVPATNIAAIYARLGQRARAVAWIERGFAERDVALVKTACEPDFDSIRTDPEFRRIVGVVGVPLGRARR